MHSSLYKEQEKLIFIKYCQITETIIIISKIAGIHLISNTIGIVMSFDWLSPCENIVLFIKRHKSHCSEIISVPVPSNWHLAIFM